jgi:putative membrane protein
MSELLKVGWTWHPSVVIGFSIWTLLYEFMVRRGQKLPLFQQVAFHVGTLIGLIALVSPLDELGDEYLFSAHMGQHLLLMFGTAPLWLIGTPGWLVDKIIPKGLTKSVEWLAAPIAAYVAFISVIFFWHIPSIYGMAQENEAIHIIEHLTFIGAGLIGWWPVMGADSSHISKPEPPVRMLYLFLLAVPCTALAAILTFSQKPLYAFYITASHPFSLDALQDQHLGGLLMWMPTHMFLLLALGITFIKWFVDSDRKTEKLLFNNQ